MKKLLLILLAASLVAVAFTSCKKDENNGETPTTYYKVVFDANGGKIDGKDTLVCTVASGSTLTKPNDPKLDSCIFLGWFLADGTQWDFSTAVTKDMTLYADWQKIAPKEGTRLMIIRFKDKFENPHAHVFQYCYTVDGNGEYKLDTIKVGRDAYPLKYEPDTAIILSNAAKVNWGRIDFGKKGAFIDAKNFSHISGGVFSLEYKAGRSDDFMSPSFLDSVAYVKNGDTTVIAKNVELYDADGDGRFDSYLSFETEFSDSPSTVTFDYTKYKGCYSCIFTPVFFTYTFIENAWKETPQGTGESVLAAAVFNTDFFGSRSYYAPKSMTIQKGAEKVTLGVDFKSEELAGGGILNTTNIKLPEGSYYSELTFYEAYLAD